MLHFLSDFIHLIYPEVCSACGESLVKGEEAVCLKCIFNLPKTNYHLQADNPIEKRFWGRARIENATAFFYFQKGSSFQHLLHELKYKGNQQVGVALGKYLGGELLFSEKFRSIDVIVPVPLHKNKLLKRGYNQSACIADGIGSIMQKSVDEGNLIRVVENPTQTKKSVYERWENTDGIFENTNTAFFSNKHILLVDDVLTTGSTVIACANELLKSDRCKVSIATLAVA